MRYNVCLTLAFVFLFTSAQAANSGDVQEVTQMLKNRINSVLDVLDKEKIEEAEKKKEIMSIVEPVIDFELMARLTLGRTNWGRLSAAEQKEFVELFVERLKDSYLDKTTLYSDQEVLYLEGFKEQGKVHVPMEIVANDEEAKVLYKFYPAQAGWKVYDVEVNGVSLIRSYRSQFNEILRNGSVRNLFEELRKGGND
ncbi:MAG: ABC transporter substrate-binding protein [Desulfosalsimonadaceae bacterium]